MSQIRIALDEVQQIAENIRVCNINLEDVLDYVCQLMNGLRTVWVSEGSEELIARFNAFSRRFADESETIESYAAFLDYTVASYATHESAIKANAANFN